MKILSGLLLLLAGSTAACTHTVTPTLVDDSSWVDPPGAGSAPPSAKASEQAAAPPQTPAEIPGSMPAPEPLEAK